VVGADEKSRGIREGCVISDHGSVYVPVWGHDRQMLDLIMKASGNIADNSVSGKEPIRVQVHRR
jgi:hypothetical protein